MFLTEGDDINDTISYEMNSEYHFDILNGPINTAELKKNIALLKNEKSPGSDYTVNEYTKRTQDLL